VPPLNLYARVRFLYPFCTRDRGCSAHPAFPAPSSLRDTKRKPGASPAARMWTCICCLKFESKLSIRHCEQAARDNKTVIAWLDLALTGRSRAPRHLDWTRLSLEYWADRSSRAITRDVIAGHSSLPYTDYVNLSALPAIHPLRKTLLKFDGYAGQARV
jgi:hypothetical protein